MKAAFIVPYMLAGLLLVACDTQGMTGVQVSYKPPLVPVQVTVDSDGAISVSTNYSVVTPIGTFSAGAYVNPSQYFKAKSILTVRFNGQDTIYRLAGEDFEINFQSGFYEKVKLEKKAGNVLLELRRLEATRSDLVPSRHPTAKPLLSPESGGATLPSTLHLRVGESLTPAAEWEWVCTGDFALINASGDRFEYFDNASDTGLVLVIAPDSRIALAGPSNMPQGHNVGDCLRFFPAERQRGISQAVSAQLSGGCGDRCLSTRIVELGTDGKVLADYWKP